MQAEACIPNIGPGQRRLRTIVGVVFLVAALAVLASTVAGGAPRAWRLASLPVFWIAFVCLIQARAKTCTWLAVRGLRDWDHGAERIDDAEELTAVRGQARGVLRNAAVATLLVAVIALVIP